MTNASAATANKHAIISVDARGDSSPKRINPIPAMA
jgi:hypothetical protein